MDMEFHTKLDRLMREQGWNMETLGKASGVSASTISNWSRGKYVPKLKDLVELARVLGVSLDYLGREDMTEPAPDNLSEAQRRILWLAGIIGYDIAADKLARDNAIPGPPKTLPDGPAKREFVTEVPPSTQKPKRGRRRKA